MKKKIIGCPLWFFPLTDAIRYSFCLYVWISSSISSHFLGITMYGTLIKEIARGAQFGSLPNWFKLFFPSYFSIQIVLFLTFPFQWRRQFFGTQQRNLIKYCVNRIEKNEKKTSKKPFILIWFDDRHISIRNHLYQVFTKSGSIITYGSICRTIMPRSRR